MVIVCTSIKEYLLSMQQQGKVTFMPQFTFLTHLYNSCTKRICFSHFPLTRLI
jgi:hypothetical protein